jgi:hypothetical protein
MTYICCVYSALPEPFLFEWKQAKKPIHKLPNDPYATLPPGPSLRGDEIVNGDAEPLEPASNPQVKIGTVRQQGSSRGISTRKIDKLPIFTVDPRQMPDHLRQSHDRKARGVHHRLNA